MYAIILLVASTVLTDWQDTPFVRGDADQMHHVKAEDGYFILQYLFNGGPHPLCLDSADFNDDGTINITDAIEIFSFCFEGCEEGYILDKDRTPDGLDCVMYEL
jgi:hypothetical protein